MLAKVRALYCTISCGRSWRWESTNLNAVSAPTVAVTRLCVLPWVLRVDPCTTGMLSTCGSQDATLMNCQ